MSDWPLAWSLLIHRVPDQLCSIALARAVSVVDPAPMTQNLALSFYFCDCEDWEC